MATSSYTYDDLARLTDLTHQDSSQSTLADYDWVYDGNNWVTSFTSSQDGSVTYTYDADGQLTGADYSYQTDEAYTYDETGNRTNAGYVTDPNNRLQADGTFTYLYDDEGNRTKRTNVSTGDVVEYTWDHRNRLTKVTFKNNVGTVTKELEYVYDVFDRRIEKRLDGDGNGSFETEEHYVYDGNDIVLQYDESSSLTNRYLHGPAVDQVLADEDALDNVLWPLADNQGTVRDLVNSSGVVQNHLTYDAFGNITGETNATVDHLYAYTGREWDEDAELYYYRARWYDATAGRFLSEDPIGFGGGDTNLSRYVTNSAPNLIDSSGQSIYGDIEIWFGGGDYQPPLPRPGQPTFPPNFTPSEDYWAYFWPWNNPQGPKSQSSNS